ncbi:DUF2079 domain-containing protein [Fluviicola sp.]|uniref:DUF2079 domain-containing protein n=1 Tax=Fluviicola sp. TaxID=1917219 RepID=UPI0031DAC041
MADNTKSDLIKYLLFSGMGLLLFRPAYLLMLVPVFFQKLFHDVPAIWGAGFHYCIEFTPIFAIGIFEVIDKLKKESFKRIAGTINVVLAMVMTHKRLSHPYFYAPNVTINFLSGKHYQKEYAVKPVYEAFKLIPEDAVVSCQSNLVPHLANRDFCYMYPIVKDAEYVMFSTKDVWYPFFSDSLFQAEIEHFRQSADWIKLVDNQEVLLVKRK